MEILDVRTTRHTELVDITHSVNNIVKKSKFEEAFCLVYVPHTTAGVLINENADPSVKEDILMALSRAVPDNLPFRHTEGNSTGHVKSVLTGCSVLVPVKNGELQLGTWQGIFFAEFDGPRNRHVCVSLICDKK
ncbi:MAG: secondary thiamine-phosphate synthase enzyme YjbQ [Planctomycetota bacterium]